MAGKLLIEHPGCGNGGGRSKAGARRGVQLPEADSLLAAVVDSTDDAILTLTPEGRITSWNSGAEKMFGWAADEVLGRDLSFLAPPDRVAEIEDLRRRVLLGERVRNLQTVRLRRDGSLVHISLGICAIRDPQGRVLGTASISRDIGEQLRAARALKVSQEHYHALFEQSRDGLLIAQQGRLLAANPALCSILGYSQAELLSLPPQEAFASAEEREQVWLELDTRGFVASREVTLVRRDAKLVHALVTAWAWRGEDGRPLGFQAIVRDVTARRHLEQQLMHSQKMDALGRLAGGVAHDFKNLLSVVSGWVELLSQSLPEDDPRRADIANVMASIDHGVGLTRQLLSVSRKGAGIPRPVDLNRVMAEMDGMLRRILGSDVVLVLELEPDLPLVRVDPAQLEQVVMNLVVNAREAMSGGGTLSLRTRSVDHGPSASRPDLAPGRYARLTVEDTGCGIPSELQSRVFEPFFTTKADGTGLGLSTVYGAVRQAGGEVWLSSAPGRGTRFDVDMPLAPAEGARREPRPEAPHPPGGTETLLLVDDEPVFRGLVARILERSGYRVLEADGPESALRQAESCGERIDLMVSDVRMPGLSGPDLARRIQAWQPGLPVLFTSGCEREVLATAADLPRVEFLEKPFRTDGLLACVRSLLDPTRT